MLINLNLDSLTDGIIIFKHYQYNENICSRFNINEWHKIVTDIHNDQEWNCFLKDYQEIVTCLSIYRCKDAKIIGFIYLYLEDYSKRIISIHGGGWEKSTMASILSFRASNFIINHLLKQKIKVRTSCLKGNERAINFINSLGFVKYKSTDKFVFLWIDHQHLYNNRTYKYFIEKSNNI